MERKGLKLQVRKLLHGKKHSVTDNPASINNRPKAHFPLSHNPSHGIKSKKWKRIPSDAISSSHNLSFLEGKKTKHRTVVAEILQNYFWKKSVIVSTTGQNKRNIYCRVKKLRKQEERKKGTKISPSPHLAPLFQLVPHKPWANFRQMPAVEAVYPVAMSTKSTLLANRPKR